MIVAKPLVVLLLVVVIFPTIRQTSDGSNLSLQLQKFDSLSGAQQVATVFNERFHGRSLLFWRRSSDVWRTSADARLAFEEQILVSSPKADINGALAVEIRSPDLARARYAVFLACLRGRFVPQSEFPIKDIPASLVSDGVRAGRISPFGPSFDRLGEETSRTLQAAIRSSNQELQTTAKLFSFALLEELSLVSTGTLASRWRSEIHKQPCYLYSPLAFSEPDQLIFLLKRSLASRGLDAAIAISTMLKTESDSEAREKEIEMLHFLDGAAVRFRQSPEGKDAILTVKNAVSNKELRYCGRRIYNSRVQRQAYWRDLEDQFLRDRFPCSLDSWATLVAVALDQEYGTHFSGPFSNGQKICGPQMQVFLSRLTEADSTFPAWEFPSTTTQNDMLNPKFLVKMQRYHDVLVKLERYP